MTPPDLGENAPLFIVLNAGSGHDDAALTRQSIEAVLDATGRRYLLFQADSEGSRSMRKLRQQIQNVSGEVDMLLAERVFLGPTFDMSGSRRQGA